MALSVPEFRDLLGSERWLDMPKLRSVSQHGIPLEVRGESWKYLLNVAKPDKSEEMSLTKRMVQSYQEFNKSNPDVVKQVRSEIQILLERYRNLEKNPKIDFFSKPEIRAKLERLLLAYVNHNRHIGYLQGMVSMLAPFVFSMPEEPDIFYCFQGLIRRIEHHFTRDGLGQLAGNFISLFQGLQPELYNDFEEEEINASDWMLSWLQFLLVRELPLECVLRLWDTYFGADDYDLHMYVCLAILTHCTEELLELEHSEILAYLQRLPHMDMDQIITKAYNIREETTVRGLLGEEVPRNQ